MPIAIHNQCLKTVTPEKAKKMPAGKKNPKPVAETSIYSEPGAARVGRRRRPRFKAPVGVRLGQTTAVNTPHTLSISVAPGTLVSALAMSPPEATACLVLAHGAGAGMTHPFMQAVAEGLAQRRIATLRYQFPYMEQGSKRTDAPALAHATVRAAVTCASARFAGLRLFAGGKSFGGRMTSQAHALAPLPGVAALVFLGFPLHPAGAPAAAAARAAHLREVDVPMLFAHGPRDALAEPAEFNAAVQALGPMATVLEIDGADHAFHVLKRSGRTDGQALDELLDGIAVWTRAWDIG
jgi:predicted alpha/beta-hydrolase family hydrolase